MSTVKPFGEAHPAPWRLGDCGQKVLDRDGGNVTIADLDGPDERELWRGIVAAVNLSAALAAFVSPAAPAPQPEPQSPRGEWARSNELRRREREGGGR
ncbi:hypothetical protein SAMN04515666_101318 [Bosea lupini]|uniref:Uncharacterized protein n=1 Tax=Bosea lupini TaxID=1036779 RepID=A0A1H7GC62_9HYPH|nr:hypothetical protein [Bosea lupini]SEK35866.1 hypothetical protein SAMN04515666_101318 [Bosea lupini]